MSKSGFNYLIKSCNNGACKSNELVEDKLGNDVYYNFGLGIYGPLLYSFTLWIHDYCIDNSIKKILFIARDGYIVKKAWDTIFDNDIDCEYFYASRSSVMTTRLPSALSVDAFLNSITDRRLIDVEGVIAGLGISEDKVSVLKEKYNISSETMIDTHAKDNSGKLWEFLNELMNCYQEMANERSEGLRTYVKQIIGGDKKVATVDIGWRGTIQEGIEKALEDCLPPVEVHGLYMGLYSNAQGKRNLKRSVAWLCDGDSKRNMNEIRIYRGLIEFFFSAPHGRTLEYKTISDGVEEPVLAQNEYDVCFGEESLDKKALARIQEGALEYCISAKKCNLRLNTNDALFPLYSYSTHANNKDINVLGRLHFCSDTMEPIAVPKYHLLYVFHISQLKKDFSKSVWKIGFMRKMLFCVPFPYRWVFNTLLALNNLL